jgi:predicted esterase
MAHDGRTLSFRGTPLRDARAAVLLLHGRGDSAQGILGLADALATEAVAFAAPQAEGNSWYPHSFLMPLERNEPYLSAALQAVQDALGELEAAGFAREKVVLMGFSQGACLATESAARYAQRYGGIVGFSGGLIGPDGAPRDYAGSLAGTPVFLGCSDIDAHIPEARVHETAEVLERLGGSVDLRIYPGMGHTINSDELEAARAIVEAARGD